MWVVVRPQMRPPGPPQGPPQEPPNGWSQGTPSWEHTKDPTLGPTQALQETASKSPRGSQGPAGSPPVASENPPRAPSARPNEAEPWMCPARAEGWTIHTLIRPGRIHHVSSRHAPQGHPRTPPEKVGGPSAHFTPRRRQTLPRSSLAAPLGCTNAPGTTLTDSPSARPPRTTPCDHQWPQPRPPPGHRQAPCVPLQEAQGRPWPPLTAAPSPRSFKDVLGLRPLEPPRSRPRPYKAAQGPGPPQAPRRCPGSPQTAKDQFPHKALRHRPASLKTAEGLPQPY